MSWGVARSILDRMKAQDDEAVASNGDSGDLGETIQSSSPEQQLHLCPLKTR